MKPYAAAPPIVLTNSELRALLIDCLTLWGVQGRVVAEGECVTVGTHEGDFVLQRAAPDMHPARWTLQTPARRVADRPPRAAPSIVALLSALRNAVGAAGTNRLRIGAPAT